MKSNTFHPPRRISSRSDFIPLGISFVSPIGETNLIATFGRSAARRRCAVGLSLTTDRRLQLYKAWGVVGRGDEFIHNILGLYFKARRIVAGVTSEILSAEKVLIYN